MTYNIKVGWYRSDRGKGKVMVLNLHTLIDQQILGGKKRTIRQPPSSIQAGA